MLGSGALGSGKPRVNTSQSDTKSPEGLSTEDSISNLAQTQGGAYYARSHGGRTVHFFTEEILDRAQALKAQGLTWDEVAEILGCTAGSLTVTLTLQKKGKWSGKHRKIRTQIEQMVVQEGKRPVDVARALGKSRQGVSQILTRMGLDREVREELKRGVR